MNEKRLVIYPKDIMLITGKSERYSRYLLKRMKTYYNKLDHQYITITEMCLYLGLDPDEVSKTII